MTATIWPGQPYPLGATSDASGTNFSVFSEIASRVELCLFDERGNERRIDLPETTGFCWHGYMPGVRPGTRYGFRVHGPYSPNEGQFCNPHKLLVDPYAKAIDGDVVWNDAVFAYTLGDTEAQPIDERDSGAYVPKSVVVDTAFDWGDDTRPRTPWRDTVVYEVHVKGFTQRHPDVPEKLRGTYAGMTTAPAIDYLKRLGVTAVELMPVHHFVHDRRLVDLGLSNYWGYNSLGFLAPHHGYSASGSAGQQVREFKEMVKALHAAGIEVILDVVYNHTCEGNHLGPSLSLKGIDNAAYYRLVDGQPRFYMDYTGTGNSLNMQHPHVLQLIMDSLRYWVLDMHVDGFRFDLAATLARELHDVDRLSAFFDIIQQDPVVSQVKLIAEPWDVGEGGYQVGNFPVLWSEWNGKYRDTVRDYWRSEGGTLGEFASRFTGSADLYQDDGRRPYASVNFVTAHDGFTLADLVAYNEKHNDANGEGNADGESHNRSWNCGVEGPTDDAEVNALRNQQCRNFFATLFLSQGVPMIVAGDEVGRTQSGNNNAYCQDNELSWIDWQNANHERLAFVERLIAFRKAHPVFRRRRFFEGRPMGDSTLPDIAWFTPAGKRMTEPDWTTGYAKSLAVFLNGEAIPTKGPRGEAVTDDSFYLLWNAHYEPLEFCLPDEEWGKGWQEVLDTHASVGFVESSAPLRTGSKLSVAARALRVFRLVP